MARILYVTSAWDGLWDLLIEERDPRGMPGFMRPLRELARRGHTVDMIILAAGDPPEPTVPDWLAGSRLELVRWDGTGPVRGIRSAARLRRSMHAALTEGGYDFVYGQGAGGTLATAIAQRRGVTNAMRLYGVMSVYQTVRRHLGEADRPGPLRRLRMHLALLARHPMTYLAFRLPKEFLLVTDDGSHADVIHRHVHGDYEWVYLRNGVDSSLLAAAPRWEGEPDRPELAAPFLLYPARVSPDKRQDLAVELLAHVPDDRRPNLLLVGHTNEPAYLAHIEALAAARGVAGSLAVFGPVDQRVLWRLYDHPNCIAALSLYDVTNLGNAAIEAIAAGAALVTRDDGSIGSLLTHGESGIVVDDLADAVPWILRLAADPGERREMGRRARTVALSEFGTWEDRVAREIALVEAAAGRAPAGSRGTGGE